MRALVAPLAPVVAYAALFSFAVNLLLLVPPLYMLQVFDRVLTSRHVETLVLLTLAAAGALVIMSALDVLRARLLAGGAILLDRFLGPQVIERVIGAAASGRGAGDSAYSLRDVGTLRAFLTGPAIMAAFDAPWLPFFLVLIALFHPLLGAVALAGALLLVGVAVTNESATRRSTAALQAEGAPAGRFIDGSIRNAEAVHALGMLGDVTRRWMRLNDGALGALARTSEVGGTITGATKLARQSIQIAMLGVGAYLVLEQNISSGVMMAATIILGRALAPVESLIGGWRSFVDAHGALKRLARTFDEARDSAAQTELPAPLGAVSVEGVSFRFPEREQFVLRGVSFTLAPGEALGLVGPSAAGKSTLARVVLGIWKPLTGTARLDGADVHAWSRAQFGRHVGYLPQDVELFAGTVAENIARLGELDSAAVVSAAQRAHCHEMILRLPRGYDTELRDGGVGLSPGQRQRIGLARALYGAPRLVVLDEPNSNLDSEGEDALLACLRDLKAVGATVIVISHRPSLLAAADKMLVLREGAVDAFGPMQEVMARITRASQPRGEG